MLAKDFFRYVCQTSPAPMGLEVDFAHGPYIYTTDGRRYLDLISGIGVVNIGHGRPQVLAAIREQAARYLHPMVYGEFIMEAQVAYAKALAAVLPGLIDNVYFANSGTEAVEGALKLARKSTGRTKIYSFTGCYHGDTFGSLSCQSDATYRRPFEPLLPEVEALPWNDSAALKQISADTAGVIIEPIQGEGGIRIPDADFLRALRRRCHDTGALLIFDEVMTGFGRTGKLFAAEHWGIEPDVMVLAKALGGGLPLGAFAAPAQLMHTLSVNPPLAHVTTFGGNPLSCAAGHAALQILLAEKLHERATAIGERFLAGLAELRERYSMLTGLRGKGCFIGLDFASSEQTMACAERCLRAGVIVGWTLHHSTILRMAPPLILTDEEVDHALDVLDTVLGSLGE